MHWRGNVRLFRKNTKIFERGGLIMKCHWIVKVFSSAMEQYPADNDDHGPDGRDDADEANESGR